MKVVFRVDASTRIGTGHVMRCLTLAKALQQAGATSLFISRDESGQMIKKVRGSGFAVIDLLQIQKFKNKDDIEDRFHHVLPQTKDAKQTIGALGKDKPDWLVVDHYALDLVWERELKPYARRMLVIDDLVARIHDCDLFLNQNYGVEEPQYDTLLPKVCKKLLGPKYALIRPEYRKARDNMAPRSAKVKRGLIFFGGSDSVDATSRTLRALTAPEFLHIKLDVVAGVDYASLDNLKRIAKSRGKVTIHRNLPHLADLMAKADIALGAGGTTTWERCCLGLPSAVVAIADNQISACQKLMREGYIQFLGAAEDISESSISLVVSKILTDSTALKNQSLRMQSLVDGNGANRVQQAMQL